MVFTIRSIIYFYTFAIGRLGTLLPKSIIKRSIGRTSIGFLTAKVVNNGGIIVKNREIDGMLGFPLDKLGMQ